MWLDKSQHSSNTYETFAFGRRHIRLPTVTTSIIKSMLASRLLQYQKYLLHISKFILGPGPSLSPATHNLHDFPIPLLRSLTILTHSLSLYSLTITFPLYLFSLSVLHISLFPLSWHPLFLLLFYLCLSPFPSLYCYLSLPL